MDEDATVSATDSSQAPAHHRDVTVEGVGDSLNAEVKKMTRRPIRCRRSLAHSVDAC
jgi:hypothetical protein